MSAFFEKHCHASSDAKVLLIKIKQYALFHEQNFLTLPCQNSQEPKQHVCRQGGCTWKTASFFHAKSTGGLQYGLPQYNQR